MDVRLDCCSSEDLCQVMRLLDEEFILSRQREVSLAVRFPEALSETNLHNIRVAYVDRVPCAVVVARQFDWIEGDRRWTGAMIGMVCTRPQYRGRGLASSVLKASQEALQRANCDFSVLWTAVPEFYGRLGWLKADNGVFGEAIGHEPESNVQISPRVIDESAAAWIDEVRSLWLRERAIRTPSAYHVLPFPATSLELFACEVQEGQEGYAIVGRSGHTGFLYEMIGHPAAFHAIWSSIRARFGKLFVNDTSLGLSREWLSGNAHISWRPQRLAMWLPLSVQAREAPFGRWYISYLDRI